MCGLARIARRQIAEYQALRTELAELELPDVNWNFLAADMRANIRLGLEAGACVRDATQVFRALEPAARRCVRESGAAGWVGFLPARLCGRCASGEPLHGSGCACFAVRPDRASKFAPARDSLTLLNHHGNAANQTVSAQGDIGARYIDGETGSVTINNVYLQ